MAGKFKIQIQFQFGREGPIFGPGDTLSGRASVVTEGTLRFKVGG